MPLLGWFMAQIVGLLSGPMVWFGGPEGVREEVSRWCLYILFICIAEFISWKLRMKAFGTMGQNVSSQLKRDLYKSILMKNIGFFDHRD